MLRASRPDCPERSPDVLSSNNTALNLFLEPISVIDGDDYWDKPSVFVFHCECCHRLYLFRHGSNQRSYVFSLTDVISPVFSEMESDFQEVFFLHIGDYENKVFKGFWSNDRKRMLLEYHNKIAVFEAESIYEKDEMIYRHDCPVKFIFDESSVDRSVTARTVRCSCGWLINQEVCDTESFIDLYDEANWIIFVRYALGMEEKLKISDIRKRGLCCEKCKRLLLPDETGQYSVYKPLNEVKNVDAVFSILWCFVKPPDELDFPIEEYESHVEDSVELFEQFNKIYISEDKKCL